MFSYNEVLSLLSQMLFLTLATSSILQGILWKSIFIYLLTDVCIQIPSSNSLSLGRTVSLVPFLLVNSDNSLYKKTIR